MEIDNSEEKKKLIITEGKGNGEVKR